MRNQILCLFFFSVLISTNCFAVVQLAGHWIAHDGKVSSTIGMSAKCSQVEIIIEQNENHITTVKYVADCGVMGSHWGPVQQDIKNGKVYEAEQEVGTINETTLMTTSQDGGIAYAYNLRLIKGPQGQPILESYYGTKNFTGSIVIEANLEKVESANLLAKKAPELSCPGFAKTILIDVPWTNTAEGEPIYTYMYDNFDSSKAMVLQFQVPKGLPVSTMNGRLNMFEFPGAAALRVAVFSETACDFNADAGKPLGYVVNGESALYFALQVGGKPQNGVVDMQPGKTYYLNIANLDKYKNPSCPVSPCDMAINFQVPK